jgi:hypothetical protein
MEALTEFKTEYYDTIPIAERFPLSIGDFRKLKHYPSSQIRVARYLMAKDEATKKKMFNRPDSKWRVEDTYFLKKIVEESVSYVFVYEFLLTHGPFMFRPLSKKK